MANNTAHLQELFQKWHGKRLSSSSNAAILLGGGSWDLGSITWKGGDEYYSFDPILQAYREFWRWLLVTYPGVDVYWKSLSAMHPHNLDFTSVKAENLDTVKKGTMYVSAGRALAFDQALRHLIQSEFEGRIGILDIYNATALSAEWLFSADLHHYRWELNRYMLTEWFY